MANRKARFTQADITRALKGCMDGGMEIGGLRLDIDGSITVIAKGFEHSNEDWFKDGPLYRPNPLDRLHGTS